MDRLPPEVICDIFSINLPRRTPGDERISYSDSVTVPLLFTHVCRSWRNLALSYGELWAHLCIEFVPFQSEARRERMVDIFDTWFSRTKDVPLNFLFRCELSGEQEPSGHSHAEHIIATLVSQQHRWRNMHLVWRNVNFSRDFSGVDLTSMPLLRSLVLSSKTMHTIETIPVIVNLSQSLQLSHVFLDGSYTLVCDDRLIRCPIEKARLGFSRFSLSVTDTCLNFLSSVTSLTEFHLDCSVMSASQLLYRGDPVVVPGLRNVAFCNDQSSLFLRWLTLPSLRALRINSQLEDVGEIIPDFISRSSPPLSFLELRCGSIDENSLISVLRSLPTLRELRTLDCNVPDRFFSALAETDDVSGRCAICPHLSSFCFRDKLYAQNFYSGSYEAIVDALIDMLKFRWQMGSFKRGRLHINSSLSFEIDPNNAESMSLLRKRISGSGLIVQSGEVLRYPFTSWRLAND